MKYLIQHPDPEIGKSQLLRIMDVFLLGPAMIYVGSTGKVPEWLKAVAIVAGAGTIVFNWTNYVRLRKHLARQNSILPAVRV